jgi:hypothetical protein
MPPSASTSRHWPGFISAETTTGNCGFHTGSQAAWSWLCPYTGLYEITTTGIIVTNAAGPIVQANIGVTGTTYFGCSKGTPTTVPGGADGAIILPLVGGFDYVQGLIVSTAAATTDVATGLTCSLEIAYVSG